MLNIVLNPTEEIKNNIVLALEEFSTFIEQQYLITKIIKYCCSLSIVNSSRADPQPMEHDSRKQSEGKEGSSKHWE